jgi:hypothetical protein
MLLEPIRIVARRVRAGIMCIRTRRVLCVVHGAMARRRCALPRVAKPNVSPAMKIRMTQNPHR